MLSAVGVNDVNHLTVERHGVIHFLTAESIENAGKVCVFILLSKGTFCVFLRVLDLFGNHPGQLFDQFHFRLPKDLPPICP